MRGPPLGPPGGTVGPAVWAGGPQRAQHMGGGGMSIGNQWAIDHILYKMYKKQDIIYVKYLILHVKYLISYVK